MSFRAVAMMGTSCGVVCSNLRTSSNPMPREDGLTRAKGFIVVVVVVVVLWVVLHKVQPNGWCGRSWWWYRVCDTNNAVRRTHRHCLRYVKDLEIGSRCNGRMVGRGGAGRAGPPEARSSTSSSSSSSIMSQASLAPVSRDMCPGSGDACLSPQDLV